MKVLFVCVGNVGRSQVAQSIFASLSDYPSDSAGTKVDDLIASGRAPGRRLKDVVVSGRSSRTPFPVQYMSGRGIDISENQRKQLTPELMAEADRVVVMAEKESWPAFLVGSDKVTEWDLADPGYMTQEAGNAIFDEIARRVEELVQDIS